jgi:glyoxylase-like metal-dependent hydrolase (beta-lactamase superfamily II)
MDPKSPPNPPTCFTAQRLNQTTFLIVEDDKYHEQPFIYVKIQPKAIIVIDIGCGGASKNPDAQLKSLRGFIETYPVESNDDSPLNPDGTKAYVVILTHCHFDHIGAIEQFNDLPHSTIWASGYDIPFVSDPDLLPTHSLCKFVGMDTPHFKVTHWANDGENVTDSGLVIYQTPGHTPDELAVWDGDERVLFAGDSAYEWAPIIFPVEGDIEAYRESLKKMLLFVRGNNRKDGEERDCKRVSIACGHITKDADAEELLDEILEFLCMVERGEVESKAWRQFRGEEEVIYERDDSKLSFGGPKSKFDKFIHH